MHAQIGVYAGHASLNEAFGKWCEPPLRFPLLRVVAPQCLRAIHSSYADYDVGALRYRDSPQLPSVESHNGFAQREHTIFPRTIAGSVLGLGECSGNTHVLETNEAGAYLSNQKDESAEYSYDILQRTYRRNVSRHTASR